MNHGNSREVASPSENLTMAPKRKAHDDDPSAMTGREKKKHRMNSARNIDVQSLHLVSIPNSMSSMPSTIDVEKFVEVSW